MKNIQRKRNIAIDKQTQINISKALLSNLKNQETYANTKKMNENRLSCVVFIFREPWYYYVDSYRTKKSTYAIGGNQMHDNLDIIH